MNDQVRENLERLQSGHEATCPTCTHLANNMPLAVSIPSGNLREIFDDGCLLSKQEQVKRGKLDSVPAECAEAKLGTADSVFTYASTFRYPFAPDPLGVGLFYTPAAERAHTAVEECRATPFDSGGVFNFLPPKNKEVNPIDFVRNHELPVPDYRKLLASHLQHFFDNPWHYLTDDGPNEKWPMNVDRSKADARAWTFEVRFPNEFSINSHVTTAFIPDTADNDPCILRQKSRWRKQGVDIQPYETNPLDGVFDSLQTAGREYIRSTMET